MGASIEQRTISCEGAEKVIAEARRLAGVLGVPMSIAVVDVAGVLKAFHRMEGAKQLSVESSQRKAYTSATIGLPTLGYYNAKRDGPDIVLLGQLPGVTAFGGGHPIVERGAVIGAVGVGGGSAEQDAELAAAAAAVIT
jgi:uncharacterized protein GlcG (DUF336 family)